MFQGDTKDADMVMKDTLAEDTGLVVEIYYTILSAINQFLIFLLKSN